MPVPGLLFPESISMATNGLTVTTTFSAPAAIINSNGVIAQAHGTTNGQDTQTYTNTFSGLVPGVGSATAYLVAQFTTIQQVPVSIPGPPPGHPSYNPNFVPTTGYSITIDTFNLLTTLTAPDNVTQFELLRGTLTAGSSAFTGISTQFQKRAGNYKASPPHYVASSFQLLQNVAYSMVVNTNSGSPITTTLPPLTSSAGLAFSLINYGSQVWTIAGNSADIFVSADGPRPTITIPAYGSVTVWTEGAIWHVLGRAPTSVRSVLRSAVLPYTPTAADAGGFFEFGSGGTVTLTNGAPYVFNPGTTISFFNVGAAPVAVATSGGPYIVGPGATTFYVTSVSLNQYDYIDLMWDGVNWFILSASNSLLNNTGKAVYGPGSYTFTVPHNITALRVRLWAAGGGGGGSTAGGVGSSGGGGGYAEKTITTGIVPGATIAVTVGAGGAAGGSSGTGGTGGLSSFGGLVGATGGTGGTAGVGGIETASAGSPGTGAGYGGDFVITGQAGGLGYQISVGSYILAQGGGTFGGQPSQLAYTGIALSGAGGTYPGGGGGSGGLSGGGGAGADGLIIVEWNQ